MGTFIPSAYSGLNPDAILALTEAGLAIGQKTVSTLQEQKAAEKAAKQRRRRRRRAQQQAAQTAVVQAPEQPVNWPLILGAGALLLGGVMLLQKKQTKKGSKK